MKFILILVGLTCLNFLSANEYCQICRTHTMCRYKEDVYPDNCTDYRNIEMTLDNETDIVEIHNSLRNYVASGGFVNESKMHFPEAAAMMYLRWNEELAEIAQRWADQCLSDETPDECRDTDEFFVGQIVINTPIASMENPPRFSKILMTRWGHSFIRFNTKDVLQFDPAVGNAADYSQYIWDTTEYIGCGAILYKNHDASKKKPAPMLRLVCNYGPTGNVDGKPIYKIGQPCSLCTSNKCHKKFAALCISEKKASATYRKNKMKEEIKKIMMERYNMFKNGDKCFCVDKYQFDGSVKLDLSYLQTALIVVSIVWLAR